MDLRAHGVGKVSQESGVIAALACGAHRRRSQRKETWREICGVMRDESRILRLKAEDHERWIRVSQP